MIAVVSSFARLVDPRWIDPALQCLEIGAAVRELAIRLRQHAAVEDPVRLDGDFRRCLERNPTRLLPELVFPHVRTSAVGDLVLAVGRSPRGIMIGPEGPPARLIFLLASPASRVSEHLAVIADLARQLTRPGVIARLIAADDAEHFAQLLQPRE